jgi:hypothetical protein
MHLIHSPRPERVKEGRIGVGVVLHVVWTERALLNHSAVIEVRYNLSENGLCLVPERVVWRIVAMGSELMRSGYSNAVFAPTTTIGSPLEAQ